MNLKVCTKCGGEPKPLSEFYKDSCKRDGFRGYCKSCDKATSAKYREGHPEQHKVAKARWLVANIDKNKATKSDYRSANIEKIKMYSAKWYSENLGKVKATTSKYRSTDAAKIIYAAHCSRRRARKLHATPSWDAELTEFAFAEARNLAVRREAATGIEWHVDHVIPLKGRTVCGLHVWNNFAVIPARENIRKGNRLLVDM